MPHSDGENAARAQAQLHAEEYHDLLNIEYAEYAAEYAEYAALRADDLGPCDA